jgi:hypothetical protein
LYIKINDDNPLQSVAWLHYDAWKNQATIPDGNPEQMPQLTAAHIGVVLQL